MQILKTIIYLSTILLFTNCSITESNPFNGQWYDQENCWVNISENKNELFIEYWGGACQGSLRGIWKEDKYELTHTYSECNFSQFNNDNILNKRIGYAFIEDNLLIFDLFKSDDLLKEGKTIFHNENDHYNEMETLEKKLDTSEPIVIPNSIKLSMKDEDSHCFINSIHSENNLTFIDVDFVNLGTNKNNYGEESTVIINNNPKLRTYYLDGENQNILEIQSIKDLLLFDTKTLFWIECKEGHVISLIEAGLPG